MSVKILADYVAYCKDLKNVHEKNGRSLINSQVGFCIPGGGHAFHVFVKYTCAAICLVNAV